LREGKKGLLTRLVQPFIILAKGFQKKKGGKGREETEKIMSINGVVSGTTAIDSKDIGDVNGCGEETEKG
jgi:hypothetical protein